MEKGQTDAKIDPVQSDLTLINRIKENNDEDSLLELINRHSGIYHTMVNYFLSGSNNNLEKNVLNQEKDLAVYESAKNYDPNRKTKFSTHLANQTKWKCLNILNKKKKVKEVFLDDEDCFIEPYSDSFYENIKKEEALAAFSKCLKKEQDKRIKKIIDRRYNVNNNKLTPWREIAEDLEMSIQGCINLHNKFIDKVKKQTHNV
jgi:DNA-directed RNA polymerase specialized sigma subunit|tara:strand:+ start:378 stop:986 length:609 start_codon:yes stop_codon:yes gene_type:complete